jgi:predicted pyridoxine 5'-phosphate oxidase superfamily flavin-nucleotide-binding protein
VLAGEPGFVEALDARTVRLAAAPLPSDPLAAVLPGPVPAGLLVIDLTTRRRLRLNGSLERHADGTLVLRTAEVFWNCPKYIQQRVPDAAVSGTREPIAPGGGAALGAAQQRWIARADTFFITTAHAERGVDASHRGGRPGFVQVVDAHTLVWPEYAGNGMFQTLGNLAVDPRCGLLLVDFVTGVTLQLSGRARIVWDEERAARVAGAERLVELRIDRVREAPGPDALRWRLLGPSPFNPP